MNIMDITYSKSLKFSDTQYVCCNYTQIQTNLSFLGEICPVGAHGIANAVDPDQTAPLGLHCLPMPVCWKT